jgi:hypothetical protein
MPDTASSPPSGQAFALTTRQKRLRNTTVVIILFIVAMLTIAMLHPFFHPDTSSIVTDRARKALAAQYIVILGYYTVVFALALALLFIAWLYVREIRLQLLMAQRDIWKSVAERQAEERSRERQETDSEEK